MPPWSGFLDEVSKPTPETPLVLVRMSGGFAAAHDAAGHQKVGFTEALFCESARFCPRSSTLCSDDKHAPTTLMFPQFELAFSSDASTATFIVLAVKQVSDIPTAISPREPTTTDRVTAAALANFAGDPCGLLTIPEFEAATGIPTRDHSTAASSPTTALCVWNRVTPIGQDFLLGQDSLQKIAWTAVLSQYPPPPVAHHVGGLGEEAFCVTAGSASYLNVELNANWTLGVSSPSCAADRELAGEALSRLNAH